MRKLVLCDIHNTLLDSRHRQCEDTFFLSLIKNDTVNYPLQRILKTLQDNGYEIIFFAYCNTRFKSVVEQALMKAGFKPEEYTLYTDVSNKHVQTSQQLKEYVYENFLKDEDIRVVIDSSPASVDYWKSKELYVMVPQYE